MKSKGVSMANTIKLTITLPVSAEVLYKAWLSGKEHAAFTGSPAKCSAKVGGSFSIWEGYIIGKNTELKPFSKIVQAWRTTEFPEDAPDSKLEVVFEKAAKGTKLSLIHSNIPKGQAADYKQGWIDYYFEPMKSHFAKKK